MLRKFPRQLSSHPNPVELLFPNPFTVNCHTVMHNCGDTFVPLQDAIFEAFYRALFKEDLSDAEYKLFSLRLITPLLA